MHHVQLMRAAAPILKANPDGGVYLMTLSVAVLLPLKWWESCLLQLGYNAWWEQYAILSHQSCWCPFDEMPCIYARAKDQSKCNPSRSTFD